jgi:1-deoxy-D-xylulose-5-phosphate reductoisomerase
VPVDSEHSAIAQALRAGEDEVRRLVLTASGGPSAAATGRTREVTPAEALAHPTWDMGRVVTTNSATLVNKGLEVIEAHLLFGVDYDDIDVVVHPQSIVHSMVEFIDGSTIAQASPPDMRLPISLGLDWPHRVAASACRWTGRPRRRGRSSRSTTRRSPRSRSPSTWAARAGRTLPCSMRRTSRRWMPSTRAPRLSRHPGHRPEVVDAHVRPLSSRSPSRRKAGRAPRRIG